MDLTLLDAAGTEVATSGQAFTEGEQVVVPVTGPGSYVVEVTGYLGEPGMSYDATAVLCGPRGVRDSRALAAAPLSRTENTRPGRVSGQVGRH